jgi:hypothetical protein
MGTMFRYVADAALTPSDLGDCQLCERIGVTSYSFTGVITDPSRAANPQLAQEDPHVFALCAACILGGNVRKHDSEIAEIRRIVNAFAVDRAAAIANYHTLPHIPLMMQHRDWPMCCGDWCEFYGNPADYRESVEVPSLHQFWDYRPHKWDRDFELKPESLREVCVFRCLTCNRSYFIWQPT